MQPKLRGDGTTRIVSVCVRGGPASRPQSTLARYELMSLVIADLRRHGWSHLDALVFPAGFYRSSRWLAPLRSEARREALDHADLGSVCRTAARRLRRRSPGCLVVVGVDTNRYKPWSFRGDQAIAAFDETGCVAVTRKVFPVDGDTNEYERSAYLLDEQDARTADRFVQLPSGRTAVLCVCYDAFVFSELALGPTAKLAAMRYRTDASSGWDYMSRGEAIRWITELKRNVVEQRPTVVLNPIHGFDRPGAEVFWQRHALASASSYLGGAMAVGAAHFVQRLPPRADSTLMAKDVPAAHIGEGVTRASHAGIPLASFVSTVPGRRPLQALVRLYQD